MRTVLALALVTGLGRWPALGRRPRRRPEAGDPVSDIVLLADLVVLGLVAGMPFTAALAASADHVHPTLGADVRRVVRAARLDGGAEAFAAVTGPLSRLLSLAARAVATGAPLAAAVAAFADEARNGERARALAAARRLAVRLIFPLALLILPGFVVLVAGPVVLDGLARLDL